MLTFELVSMTLSNSIISTFAMVSFKQLLLLGKEESAEALSCEEMDHIYQTASMSAGVFFHIKEGKAGGYTPYLFVVLKKRSYAASSLFVIRMSMPLIFNKLCPLTINSHLQDFRVVLGSWASSHLSDLKVIRSFCQFFFFHMGLCIL